VCRNTPCGILYTTLHHGGMACTNDSFNVASAASTFTQELVPAIGHCHLVWLLCRAVSCPALKETISQGNLGLTTEW
jgi:hypothetical protein